MLVVKGLRKSFRTSSRGEVHAVRGISFEVRPGEIYALLGPNGAGKTTTLRMVCTLETPDDGQLLLDGVDARAEPVRARSKLAYVPAEAGLPDRMTPLEVVTSFGRIQGVTHPAERARDLLQQLGATAYLGSACGDLSTGMKRRVVLARALVHEPRILLLDEPTDGLDVQGRRDVLEFVRGQARGGRVVVLSSHIMGEVEQIADRIGVVAGGRLVLEGTVAELLAHTRTTRLDDAFLALVEAPE